MAENARDAMDGGGTLRLSTDLVHLEGREKPGDSALLDGDYVVLAVSDNGPGMPPEVAERAFDPFFTTADPTRAGLGLSVVYSLARQSGGLAVIESSEGQGTTVKLFLSEAREQEVPAAVSALGLSFIGPQVPAGRRAEPWPNELPHTSDNVPGSRRTLSHPFSTYGRFSSIIALFLTDQTCKAGTESEPML